MNIKLWDLPPLDKEAAVNLAKDCGIPPLLAALFMVRGFSDQEGVSRLLSRERLSDPYQMKDMDRAVARIRRALEDFEKIAIYGDYDADGVTATAILYTYLRGKNADVSFYIPQRDGEGYGMNLSAVDTLAREGVELIITVDNGISANQPTPRAWELMWWSRTTISPMRKFQKPPPWWTPIRWTTRVLSGSSPGPGSP